MAYKMNNNELIHRIWMFNKNIFQCYRFSIIYFFFLLYIAFRPNGFIFSIPLVINIISVMLLISIIAQIPYKPIKVILNIIIIFFISWSTFFAFEFSDWIWTEAVISILNTDSKEALDMSSTFLLTAIISIAINITLILLSEKEFKKGLPLPITFTIILFLSSFIFMIYRAQSLQLGRGPLIHKILALPSFRIEYSSTIYLTYAAPVLYSNITTLYIAIQEFNNIKNNISNINSRKKPSFLYTDSTTIKNQIERIYLIIGESSNRHHYSLYGYDRPTTPFLDSLNNNSKTFSYYKAISPAPSTAQSILRLLSFSGIQFSSDELRLKSSLGIGIDNHYKTYWISNQPSLGGPENIISTFPTEAENVYYTDSPSLLDPNHSIIKDITLIPEIKRMHDTNKKQFTIIHLFGSHIHYSSKFDNKDEQAIPKITKDNTFNNVDYYDRSIHHTDRVLREIYNLLKGDHNSIAIYISDHGEIVGAGHGFMQQFEDQYSIPLIFFNFTDIDIDNLVKKYKNSEDENFNTVNLCYILAELMGYQVTPERVKFALENSPFVYLPNGEIKRFEDIKNIK